MSFSSGHEGGIGTCCEKPSRRNVLHHLSSITTSYFFVVCFLYLLVGYECIFCVLIVGIFRLYKSVHAVGVVND